MRNLLTLDAYRHTDQTIIEWFGNAGGERRGVFVVPSPVDRAPMIVVASSEEGWDHVSASRSDRTPTWHEMDHIKQLFFRENEMAMQLHVPPSARVSYHPYSLHLWRPWVADIPRPPAYFLGPKV